MSHRIRCHACTAGHHTTAAEVRSCQAEAANIAAQIAAEVAAEASIERYFEEGPHGSQYSGSDEEARDRYLDSLQGF